MAQDQFKAFLEAVSADSSLQVKLNSAADAEIVVAIAKDAGFVISAEAVENHLKEKLDESDVELTAEQLEAVAGGFWPGFSFGAPPPPWPGGIWGVSKPSGSAVGGGWDPAAAGGPSRGRGL